MSHKWVGAEIIPIDYGSGFALYLTMECADYGCYDVRTIGPANDMDGGPNDVGPMVATTMYTSIDGHQRAATPKERAEALALAARWNFQVPGLKVSL